MPMITTTISTNVDERHMSEPNRITHNCRKFISRCKRLADYIGQLVKTGRVINDQDTMLRNYTSKLNQFRERNDRRSEYT